MHLTRHQPPVRKTFLALIICTGIRSTGFAGMPDSVIAEPQLPSLRTAKTIERQLLRRIDEGCQCPGCIPGYNADTACFAPILKYCHNFHREEREEGESAVDSVTLRDYLIAMSTYHQLGSVKQTILPEFSHQRFLETVKNEEKIIEKPWYLKLLDYIINWIYVHIWKPLYESLAARFGHERLIRFILITLIALTVFATIITTTVFFVRRFYPVNDTADGTVHHKNRISHVKKEIWLERAKAAVSENRYDEAVTCIYRHCTEWYTIRNKIKRFEWWTNRQFLQLVKARFSTDHTAVVRIITSYEQCIFGHFSIDHTRVTDLLSLASSLSGKQS